MIKRVHRIIFNIASKKTGSTYRMEEVEIPCLEKDEEFVNIPLKFDKKIIAIINTIKV